MLRSRNATITTAAADTVPSPARGVITPGRLRAELGRSGLSPLEFSRMANVPAVELEAWLSGDASIPACVPAAFQVLRLLTPAARKKLLDGLASKAQAQPTTSHPFSRIEDL